MSGAHSTTTGWGPQRKRGAVSLSFDNLGEAAALNRGDVIASRVPTVAVWVPSSMRRDWLVQEQT